jgi:hypothetical protein
MSWRDRARPIIAQVLRDTAGKSEAEIKKALFDAYPFGPREYHPYKIWLSEIKVQRRLPFKNRLSPAAKKRIADYERATGMKWPTNAELFTEQEESCKS